MTSQLTFTYGSKPVRALVSRESLWFAACDVFHSNRLSTNRNLLARFNPTHLSLQTFGSDAGPVRLTAVTPLGVATIAGSLGHLPARLLDGWVRRVTRELAAEHGFEPLGWTLLADGTLPARPKANTDAAEAWKALKALHPHPSQRKPNRDELALFDEDPSLPPHDPEGDRRRFQASLAEGAAAAARMEAEDPGYFDRLYASAKWM